MENAAVGVAPDIKASTITRFRIRSRYLPLDGMGIPLRTTEKDKDTRGSNKLNSSRPNNEQGGGILATYNAIPVGLGTERRFSSRRQQVAERGLARCSSSCQRPGANRGCSNNAEDSHKPTSNPERSDEFPLCDDDDTPPALLTHTRQIIL